MEMKKLIQTKEFIITTMWKVAINYIATLYSSAIFLITFFYDMTGFYSAMRMNIKVWEFETRADLYFDHFSPVERIQLIFTLIL